MVKKPKLTRTFARTAAKSVEKNLVDNAKKLKENPYLFLPDYEDKQSRKCFDKIKKSLDKVSRFSDDLKKLEKLSNKRDFNGALAGTLLIAHSEKAPYLAVADFKTGTVTYAQRGRADKEKLISVQNFDDPVLRLFGIKDKVLKRKLHVYSWDGGFVSTGIEAKPPKEFVSFITKKIGLTFQNGVATCGHIDPETAKNKKIIKKNYLHMHWKSADVVFAICEECAKSRNNTIFGITKYLLEPNLSNDFLIDVIGGFIRQTDKGTEQTVKEYLSGDLTDIEFIRKNMKHQEESIKESGGKILILDGTNYGTDIDRFIEALKPNKFEREGLKLVLEKINEPIALSNFTPHRVLEKFWKEYGLEAINSIIDNEEVAKKFSMLDDTPSNILELAFNYKERQQILSQLPKYESLQPLPKFVDTVVRAYKTFGEKEALLEIKKRPDNPKGKSIAYAFLLAFGKAEDKKWQYSQIEVEYGEFLKECAKKLLNSEPKEYHKYFKELLTNSGSSEDIDGNLI